MHFPLPPGETVQLVVAPPFIVSPPGVDENVILVSDDANPDAVIVTVTPLGAAAGDITMVGALDVTTNVAEAESTVKP